MITSDRMSSTSTARSAALERPTPRGAATLRAAVAAPSVRGAALRFSPPDAADQARCDRAHRLARWWMGASVVMLIVVQWRALPNLNPFSTTVSALAYAPGGNWLLALAGATCLVGSVALTAALVRAHMPKPAAAMVVWCAGLALATAFPTDPPGAAAISLSGQIHRYAAAAMFVAVPVAGWLAGAGRPALRRASTWCAAVGVSQVLVALPSLSPGTAIAGSPGAVWLHGVRGLAERALFATMILVLARILTVVAAPRRAPSSMPTHTLAEPQPASRRAAPQGRLGAMIPVGAPLGDEPRLAPPAARPITVAATPITVAAAPSAAPW